MITIFIKSFVIILYIFYFIILFKLLINNYKLVNKKSFVNKIKYLLLEIK